MSNVTLSPALAAILNKTAPQAAVAPPAATAAPFLPIAPLLPPAASTGPEWDASGIYAEAKGKLAATLSGLKLTPDEALIVDGALARLTQLSLTAPAAIAFAQANPGAQGTLEQMNALRDAEFSTLGDIAVAKGIELVTHVNDAIIWASNRGADFLLSKLVLL